MTNQANNTIVADRQLFQVSNILDDSTIIDRMPSPKKWSDETYDELYEARCDENTGRNAFDYGEVGTGHYNHALEMTSMERIIFEDCWDGSGKVQRQGLNVPTVSSKRRHEVLKLRLEKLAPKAVPLTLTQIDDIIDFWTIIDDEQQVWSNMTKHIAKYAIRDGSWDKGIDYYENLACELTSDDIGVNYSEVPNDIAFYESTDSVVDESAELGTSDDDNGKKSLESLKALNMANLQAGVGADPEWVRLNRIQERRGWTTEAGDYHFDKGFMPPTVFKYANFDIDESAPWIESQPAKIRRLIKLTKSAGPSLLKAIASWIHQNTLTSAQAKVVWDLYHRRMAMYDAYIESHLSPNSTAVISRIRNASPGKLGFIGFWLYDQMNNGGKTKALPHPIKRHEYRALWAQYRQAKANPTQSISQSASQSDEYLGNVEDYENYGI